MSKNVVVKYLIGRVHSWLMGMENFFGGDYFLLTLIGLCGQHEKRSTYTYICRIGYSKMGVLFTLIYSYIFFI